MPADKRKKEIALLVFLLFALCGGVIWIRTATVKATYHYVQQERELYRLEQETQAVRIRWLQMTAPKRLEGIARAIGLQPPKPSQILRYEAPPSALPPLTRNP
jgi:hypothetical protein